MKVNELLNSIVFKVSGLSVFREANRELDKTEDVARDAADGFDELDDEMTKAYKTGRIIGKVFNKVGGTLKNVVGGALRAIPQVLGLGSVGFAGLGAAALAAASDTQEAQSLMFDVLGENSSDLENWSVRNAKSFNASKNELRKFSTNFAVQFKSITDNPDDIIGFSQQFTARALDLASQRNLNSKDVAADFTSALNGSSEVVEKYGVNLKEAALTQFILETGMAKTKKQITETDKRLARFRIILRDTSDAQGNAARTSGDFANVLRNLRSRVVDLLSDVGERLIPIATSALQSLTTLIESNSEAIVDFFEKGAQSLDRFIKDGGLERIVKGLKEIIEFAAKAASGIAKLADFAVDSDEEQQERASRIASGQSTRSDRTGRAVGLLSLNPRAIAEEVRIRNALRRFNQTPEGRSANEERRLNSLGGISRFSGTPPLLTGGTTILLNQDIKVEANNNDPVSIERAVGTGATQGVRNLQRVTGASGVQQ